MPQPDIERLVRENIKSIIHMSLATTDGSAPWVCEVHFACDDNLNIYFRSLQSRRHSQAIAANPHVAGNIVRQHSLGEYPLGVYFEGTAELLEAGHAQNLAAQCLRTRLNISSDIIEDASHDDGHKFYKITVANWYVFGKFDGQSGQKYQLTWNGGERYA